MVLMMLTIIKLLLNICTPNVTGILQVVYGRWEMVQGRVSGCQSVKVSNWLLPIGYWLILGGRWEVLGVRCQVVDGIWGVGECQGVKVSECQIKKKPSGKGIPPRVFSCHRQTQNLIISSPLTTLSRLAFFCPTWTKVAEAVVVEERGLETVSIPIPVGLSSSPLQA